MNPLNPLAAQALKSLLDKNGPKSPEQKAVEADLLQLISPLVNRIQSLERRVAALERVADPDAPRAERAEDI